MSSPKTSLPTKRSSFESFRQQNQKKLDLSEFSFMNRIHDSPLKTALFSPKFTNDFLQEYEVLNELGSGAQGTVFRVKSKNTQEIFAAKSVQTMDKEDVVHLETEYKLALELIHPNLISYYKLFKDETNGVFILLMEYSEMIPLKKFMATNEDFFKNEENLRVFFKNLMQTVSFLHSNGIIHRDIKFSNLLISNDGKSIKLLDFGVAKKVSIEEINYSPQGDHKYRAPDLKLEGGYNEKSDIWSCGLVLFTLILGYNITTKKILETGSVEEFLKEKFLSKELINLLRKIININPKERVSANEILECSWLKIRKL